MARFVRDDGPTTASIVVIGEAPGRHEDVAGRPFMGASGAKLALWWREVGLSRGDLYLTNVYPYRPPNNQLDLISRKKLDWWVDQLHHRIAGLDQPVVLVPMGNTALQALTGLKKITKYRGSILAYTDRRGRTMKVIPTLHPAAAFHVQNKSASGNPGRMDKHARLDWRRIADERHDPDPRWPERTHFVAPTIRNCWDFYERARREAQVMSIDIETSRTAILCVGFAYTPTESFVIPLRDPRHWPSEREQAQAREVIEALCALPCEKVLQNGLFDTFWLWTTEQIWVRQYVWDLKAMHHCLDPVDDHDLAYMQSIYTREPYHKDEAKDPEKMARYASDFHALQTYCGLDNCVQRELQPILYERLVAEGLEDTYRQLYPPLFEPLLRMMLGGIRTADRARKVSYAKLQAELVRIQDALSAQLGEPIYGKTGLSGPKIKKLLYDVLKLPIQRDRKTKNTTANEVALRKLQLKYPELAGPAISQILDHRRQAQLMQFFDERGTDPDGYIRCEYTMTTEAGRLASRKNPRRSGRNLQNIDRTVRDTFLPDPGHVFLEADLSQAESRVVYVLSGDPHLIDLASRPASVFDAHTYNASLIFGVPPDKVTKDQRYFGKRTVHGAQRGLRGDKMAGELLKDGYVLTPEECQDMLDQYLREHPGLDVYFRWVRTQVLRHRQLVNSWGRRWDVRWEKLNDELYRRAYSFLPQSEVADLLNQWGVCALDRAIQDGRFPGVRLVAQIHDAVLVSCPPEQVEAVAHYIHGTLERPRQYTTATGVRVPLTIGVEFKVGRTWKGDIEYKTLPDAGVMIEAAQRLVGGGV